MAGRKPKPDSEKLDEINRQIEKVEDRIKQETQRLEQLKVQRTKLLSHYIIGHMKERRLDFPEVESLMEQLENQKAVCADLIAVDVQNEKAQSESLQEGSLSESNKERIVSDLKVRVNQKEKNQIQRNMQKAHYSCFNSFAKKMLLDGYVIFWSFPEISELKKEMGIVNRNMSQIVKRANATGSIYAGDFKDMQDEWLKLKARMINVIKKAYREK